MTDPKELKTTEQKVAYLLDHAPETKENYNYLVALYWTVFDDIHLSIDQIDQIIQKGKSPETISRAKRKILEDARILEMIERTYSLGE